MFLLQIFLSKTFQKVTWFNREISFIILFLSHPNAPFPSPFPINLRAYEIDQYCYSVVKSMLILYVSSLLQKVVTSYLPFAVFSQVHLNNPCISIFDMVGFAEATQASRAGPLSKYASVVYDVVRNIVSILYTYWTCYCYSLKGTSARKLFFVRR